MPSTALLCRWNGGWHEVIDAAGVATYGRREAMLSLGAQQSIPEVERIAARELESSFARYREQTTVEHRPASLVETPYIGYQPGDRLTAPGFDGTPGSVTVQAIAVTENDDGVLSYVPTIGDQILGLDFDGQLEQQVRKMTPGTFAGESRVATPVSGERSVGTFSVPAPPPGCT